MLTCREVTRTIATDELASAGWRQRLSIRFHLLMCRHCRRYASQIKNIGVAVRGIFDEQTSDLSSREQLRANILDGIPPCEKSGSDTPK